MNLFTVDLEKEKNIKTNLTTNLLNNEQYFIDKNFEIYYKPMYSSKLIDKTDVFMNLDYLPKFQSKLAKNVAVKNNSKVNISGGYLRVISNINTCQITLSKNQLEQFLKTMDNIVYDDSKSKVPDFRSASFSFADDNSLPSLPDIGVDDGLLEDTSDLNTSYIDHSYIDHSISTPTFTSSSFKALYSKFSEKSEDLKSDLSLNVKFKIDKLAISFQADVERPCQDVAELCFNEYELSILKHEKHVKFFDMTLKSLYLLDKLKDSPGKSESKTKLNEIENDLNYLLKSSVSYRGKLNK